MNELKQGDMVLLEDEKVLRIFTAIFLQQRDELQFPTLLISGVHTDKCFPHCIKKYIKG